MKNPIPYIYRLFKKYKGCPEQPHDFRDITVEDVLGSGAYVPDPNAPSWENGFDNEVKYGKLKREHQGSSLSCVGQGWSKYLEMINLMEEKHIDDLSARNIYSQIYLPEGGAYIREGSLIAVGKGCCEEGLCSSYENGNYPTEQFMRLQCDESSVTNALTYKSKKSVYLMTDRNKMTNQNWEDIRQCIWQFGGFVSGYNEHCMYASTYGLVGGKKAVKFVNSYGDGSDRWWIDGDSYPLYDITFLIDEPNPPSKIFMLKIYGDKKTNKQYLVGKDGFYRWIYNPTLLDELHNAGIVDRGQVEWQDNFDESKVLNTWAVIK